VLLHESSSLDFIDDAHIDEIRRIFNNGFTERPYSA
jgi:hypothetical protein